MSKARTASPKKTPSPKRSRRKRARASEPQPSLKAYGYVRVSTEEQATEGVSLEAQEDKIRSYAHFRDLELVEIIRDEGVSGKDLDRPGLQKLLELLDGEETEALIVYKLDRLTRNTSDLLHLVEHVFKEGNTRFFSINEDIDTDTAMGKFFLTIMGALAQMEREIISERTKAAMQYKKQLGHSLGQIPYGFLRSKGKLVKDLEEQKVLRNMKRWRREGLGYKRIADRLNDKGIKPRRKKARWHASSVSYILKRVSKPK